MITKSVTKSFTNKAGKAKRARADARMFNLSQFFEKRLADGGTISTQAADRLMEILLKQADLKDKAAERQLKRELALPATSILRDPNDEQEMARVLAELKAEVARGK